MRKWISCFLALVLLILLSLPALAAESEAQALRKRPCRFTAEYTPYDGALIFRDICSGTARQEIIRTVQAVCREHGKEPDVYLKEETDE